MRTGIFNASDCFLSLCNMLSSCTSNCYLLQVEYNRYDTETYHIIITNVFHHHEQSNRSVCISTTALSEISQLSYLHTHTPTPTHPLTHTHTHTCSVGSLKAHQIFTSHQRYYLLSVLADRECALTTRNVY